MRPLVVWRFGDGKTGHENQSRGLMEALARLRAINVIDLSPLATHTILIAGLRGCPTAWQKLPKPDLLLGAGHRTHLSLLGARYFRGGQIVVLMRPGLPLFLFDLCLIPAHDHPPQRANVFTTCGVLNRIQPATAPESDQGLFLIGGTSAHFDWDHAQIWAQIHAIIAADPAIHWTLTTSRRTPPGFLDTTHQAARSGAGREDKHSSTLPPVAQLTVVPVAKTDPNWLPRQLKRASQIWVTADSVSMVYEALTAGAAVGVLAVPQKRASRVSRGLLQLEIEHWITPFAVWQAQKTLQRPPGIFNEAERCARWILKRCPKQCPN